MTRCKLCKLLGVKEHKRQEKRLIDACWAWLRDTKSNGRRWKRLEKAAMAYGRKKRSF